MQNGETNAEAGDRLAEVRHSHYLQRDGLVQRHNGRVAHFTAFFSVHWLILAVELLCTSEHDDADALQEATFALKTNDPAGFNIVDVFAWWVVRTRVVSRSVPQAAEHAFTLLHSVFLLQQSDMLQTLRV